MWILEEEVVDPFVCVMPVSNLGEAIEVTNSVEYGLSVEIVSNDHSEVNRYIKRRTSAS